MRTYKEKALDANEGRHPETITSEDEISVGPLSGTVNIKTAPRKPRPIDQATLYRVAADRFDSIEYLRLERRHGAAGVLAFEKLLAYTRRFCPDGTLGGMDAEALAIVTRWDGEPSEFVVLLLELNLLSRSDADQSLSVTGWSLTNQWAAESKGRSDHARLKNHERWHVERKRPEPTCPYTYCQQSFTDRPQTPDGNQAEIRGRSDEESKNKGSVAKENQNLFGDSSPEMRLAGTMVALIRQTDPQFLGPKNLQPWAAEIDKMLRIDTRSPEQIAEVMAFAVSKSYRTDISDPKKLRKHFTNLVNEQKKMAAKGRPNVAGSAANQITDPQLRSIAERHRERGGDA